MFQMVQKKLKDQKGFTLIELLAVIVILAIIAAIAIPSVLNIISNSKKDAHIANAQQLAHAARLYIADQNIVLTSTPTNLKISDLTTKGYIESIKDPSNPTTTYDSDKSMVSVTKDASENVIYKVTLVSSGSTPVTYTDGSQTTSVDASQLTRDSIKLP